MKLAPLITRAYIVGDILEALGVVFNKLPGDVICTFNHTALVEAWPDEFVGKRRCPSLPSGEDSFEHLEWMLIEAAKSFWHPENGTIFAAEIAQAVLIGHYARQLNERGRERKKRRDREQDKLPTDSVTFDADHASLALRSADVFVTFDRILCEISDKLSENLATKMRWKCTVVQTPDELRAALASLMPALATENVLQ